MQVVSLPPQGCWACGEGSGKEETLWVSEVSLWGHGALRESAEEGVHTSTYVHKALVPECRGKPGFPPNPPQPGPLPTSSTNRFWSSRWQSCMRWRSALSTTQMRPSVLSK